MSALKRRLISVIAHGFETVFDHITRKEVKVPRSEVVCSVMGNVELPSTTEHENPVDEWYSVFSWYISPIYHDILDRLIRDEDLTSCSIEMRVDEESFTWGPEKPNQKEPSITDFRQNLHKY